MFNDLISILLQNKLLKNIFKLSTFQIISSLLTIIILPIMANKMNLFFFGLIIFIQIIIKYFNWFVEWGFFTGGVQKIATNKEFPNQLQSNFNNIYSSQLFLIIISIPILYLILKIFISQYKFDQFELLILLFFFISSSINPIWMLNGLEKVYFSALTQIYPKIILIFTLLFLVSSHEQFLLIFYALIIGNLFALAHIFYELNVKHKISFHFSNPFKAIKDYYYYFLSSSSLGMTNSVIPLILGLKVSLELVGIFAIAQKIMSFISLIFNPILSACFPRICDYYSKNINSYKIAIRKYSTLILVPLIFTLLMVYMFIDLVIIIFFDDQYSDSIDIIIKILPAVLFNMINSILYYFFLIPRRVDKYLMQFNILNFVLTFIISYFMISSFNILGAAYSLLISELLLLGFYLYILNKIKI